MSLVDLKTIVKGIPMESKRFDVAPYEIIDYRTNKDSNLLFLHLISPKDKPKFNIRYVFCFDLLTEKVLYCCKLKDIRYWVYEDKEFVMRQSDITSTIYNPLTSEKVWAIKNDFGCISPVYNIGVTMNGTAFNMLTGEMLWMTKIDETFTWGTVTVTNDSSLYIAANGLQYINIKTGKGWFYPVPTVLFENKRRSVGGTYGLFTNNGAKSMAENYLYRMCSNIVVDKGFIYMAGREKLYCIDSTGKLFWSSELYTQQCGTSELWRSDDTLFLINKGYASWLGTIQYTEGVFLAAFDLKTGKQYYHTGLEANTVVYSYLNDGGKLYIRSNNSLIKINIRNGKLLNELKIDKSDTRYDSYLYLASGKHQYLTGAPDDEGQLYKRYPGSIYLVGDKKLLRIDEQFKVQNLIQQYYINVTGELNDSMKFHIIDDKFYLDKYNQRYAEINIKPDAILNNKLIHLDTNSFIITDLPRK